MAMAVTYTNFGGQLVHENRGGVETSFVPDTLGSVMMCRDANGNTTYEAEYWPYGEVRSETGTNPSPWGFVGTLGYYTDEKGKSVYVRARTYLPDYARWATVDPLWPGQPAYGYALCSPVHDADTSGWAPVSHPYEPPAFGTHICRIAYMLLVWFKGKTKPIDFVPKGACETVGKTKRTCCLDMNGGKDFHLVTVEMRLWVCYFNQDVYGQQLLTGQTTPFEFPSGGWGYLLSRRRHRKAKCDPGVW